MRLMFCEFCRAHRGGGCLTPVGVNPVARAEYFAHLECIDHHGA